MGDRDFPWDRAALGVLGVAFVALRLIHLDSIYLWIDDVHTLAYRSLGRTPWGDLLSESYQHSLDTTGPFLPTLVLKALANVFGPQIVALRLPAVIVGLVSLVMLDRVLARLALSRAARVLPLLLFTLSVPSIIYGQAMQPSMYYFFSTAVQVYVFVGMVQAVKPFTPAAALFRRLRVFALVSTLLFFANFMSVLVYGMLTGCYVIVIAIKGRGRTGAGRKVAVMVLNAAILSVPLAVLTFFRVRSGDVDRAYFEGLYYPDSLADAARLVYDFLTYHFNFAYDPGLYAPLGENWLALPFGALCGAGLVLFVARCRWCSLPLAAGVLIVLAAAALRLIPFGGVRHSLTLAPFAYVAAAYGVEAIRAAARRRPAWVGQGVIAGLAAFALGTFVLSGVKLYTDRQTRVDLDAIVRWADTYAVTTVAGYCEVAPDAGLVLALMSDSQGDRLARHGLTVRNTCDHFDLAAQDAPYLLVDYRRTLHPDPAWPPLAWNAQIERGLFGDVRITPLREDVGPLDPRRMGVQSIYYPLNGFFAYLVEP